ncbi:hypothetical protein RSAG8_11923, partial [Rhizoctonia solani AG-8 WAC10335]
MLFKTLVTAFLAASGVHAHATFQQFWINGVDQGDKCVRKPASNSPVTSLTSNVTIPPTPYLGLLYSLGDSFIQSGCIPEVLSHCIVQKRVERRFIQINRVTYDKHTEELRLFLLQNLYFNTLGYLLPINIPFMHQLEVPFTLTYRDLMFHMEIDFDDDEFETKDSIDTLTIVDYF